MIRSKISPKHFENSTLQRATWLSGRTNESKTLATLHSCFSVLKDSSGNCPVCRFGRRNGKKLRNKGNRGTGIFWVVCARKRKAGVQYGDIIFLKIETASVRGRKLSPFGESQHHVCLIVGLRRSPAKRRFAGCGPIPHCRNLKQRTGNREMEGCQKQLLRTFGSFHHIGQIVGLCPAYQSVGNTKKILLFGVQNALYRYPKTLGFSTFCKVSSNFGISQTFEENFHSRLIEK